MATKKSTTTYRKRNAKPTRNVRSSSSVTDVHILIPHGGLNGDINECLLSIAHSILPQGVSAFVHVLVDRKLTADGIRPYTRKILAHRNVNLRVDYDQTSNSIIALRLKLMDAYKAAINYGASVTLKPEQQSVAVFVDSDAILLPNALAELVSAYNEAKEKPLFVEGMRIEVNGRDSEASYNHSELKAVVPGKPVAEELLHGDTCLLLLNNALIDFMHPASAHRATLLNLFDAPNVGGSDFAMTLMATSALEHTGISCPSAVCWHTASPDKGYWKNYAASDQMIRRVLGANADYADSIESVFGK